jgi:hypothetical protein
VQYDEIDEAASTMARMLLVFQMQAGKQHPALIVGNQARIVRDAADKVHRLCQQYPDADVTADPRMVEGLEKVWQDLLEGPPPEIPDSPEGL